MNLRRLFNVFCDFNLNISNDRLRIPFFNINSSNIYIIKHPTEFYNTLKDLASKSERRICISSLYLGTSKLEKDLVREFSTAKAKCQNLDLTILLDYNRATRENIEFKNNEKIIHSSKTLLMPLVCQGANVNFYLTHKFSGWRQWIQRKPQWNELSALHHMKLYLFDDNIIISGANLSDLYFTNRQDRYVLIRNSPELCDYFDDLIKTVSKFSLSLRSDGAFILNSNWKYDPKKLTHERLFKLTAKQEIEKLNTKYCKDHFDVSQADSIVFPLIQMSTIGVLDEEQVTTSLIESCPPNSDLCLASGYFNLTQSYQRYLLKCLPRCSIKLLMASEEANGFYKGRGLLKYVPLVYTRYLSNFMRTLKSNNDISIFYYCRPNWSFHAKGIWLFNKKFFLTMFGSSNYGYRSVYRDNEAQVVLLTKDPKLIQSFADEYESLLVNSKIIQNEKTDLPPIPLWVKLFARVFRSYF